MNIRKSALAVAMAATLGLPAVANAGIMLDLDGAGGPLNAIDVGTLDWGVSTLLAQTATPITGIGQQFTVLTMAKLVATYDSNGAVNTPTGLGTTFEITMIAGLKDTVTGATTLGNTGLATFQVAPSDVDFFQIFYQGAVDSNQLTGAGFNNGRLILEATEVNSATGTFSIALPILNTQRQCVVLPNNPNNCPSLLDQNGPGGSPANDNYNGQLTLTGSGSTNNLILGGIVADPTFFLANPATISLVTPNVSENVPFTTIDPADCFTTAGSTVGVGNSTVGNQACFGRTGGTGLTYGDATRGGNQGNFYFGQIGALNTVSGPDSAFQTDFSSAINGIPEPGTLLLLGLGLGASGWASRRRRA